jgi:hypothetical protein
MKIKELIQGKRITGEPLAPVSIKIGPKVDRPDFFTWSKKYKVSTRSHQNAVYYENKSYVAFQ